LNHLNTISNNECLSQKAIQKYCINKLQTDELRAVELHLTSCDMCSDAIEGYMFSTEANALLNDSVLNPFLQSKPKSIFTHFLNNRVWLMASSLLLLVGMSYAIYKAQNNQSEIAGNLKTNTETKLLENKGDNNNDIPKDEATSTKIELEKKNTQTALKEITPINVETASNPINTKTPSGAIIANETKRVNDLNDAYSKQKDLDMASKKYIPSQTTNATITNKNLESSSPTAAIPAQAIADKTSEEKIHSEIDRQKSLENTYVQNRNDNVNDNYRGNESLVNMRKQKESKGLPSNYQNNTNAIVGNNYKPKVQTSKKQSNSEKTSTLQLSQDLEQSADDLLLDKKYSDAIQAYTKLSAEYKFNNTSVYLDMATCYYALNQTALGDEALQNYATLNKLSAKKLNRLKEKIKK
jgi:hypothetical protein